MNFEPAWAQAAQQFQQSFGEQWAKALQSFGGLNAGLGAGPATGVPQIRFSAEKLHALQQAYIKEAADLWNQGLTANPAGHDKRFASDAWAANPVAAFWAAV